MELTPDPDHPGLYLITGGGLTADPDHPGLYLMSGGGLTPDPDHPGLYLLSSAIPGDLVPDLVDGFTDVAVIMDVHHPLAPAAVTGSSTVVAAVRVFSPLRPDLIAGSTVATFARSVEMMLDPVYSQATAQVDLALGGVFALDPVVGTTTVRLAGAYSLRPDLAAGSTAVSVDLRSTGTRRFVPARVAGYTQVRVVRHPDLLVNSPVLLALSAVARLESIELLVSV